MVGKQNFQPYCWLEHFTVESENDSEINIQIIGEGKNKNLGRERKVGEDFMAPLRMCIAYYMDKTLCHQLIYEHETFVWVASVLPTFTI